MSIWDHENWIADFDCICCQNFSLKIKFILGFYYYLFILITLGGFTQYMYYTCFKLYKKCFKTCGYQTLENVLNPIFKIVITEKWDSFPESAL